MTRVLAIFGILLVLILGLNSHGQNPHHINPLLRTCQIVGGAGLIISLAAKNDEFVFCQFGEIAMLDGMSLISWKSEQTSSLALAAYQKNINANMNACYQAGGQIAPGSTVEGKRFLFCLFSDSSAIELSTLSNGTSAAANAAMNQALNL